MFASVAVAAAAAAAGAASVASSVDAAAVHVQWDISSC